MMFDEISKEFTAIMRGGNKLTRVEYMQIIELLAPIVDSEGFSTEEKVFAYWNISDNYALSRDHEGTYRNHRKFEAFLKDKDEKYRLMLVCDATQKLSLICGGHESYWNGLYYDVTDKCKITKENYVIYFQVLRTAMYFRENIAEYREVGRDALEKMESFLRIFCNDSQRLWFEMIYLECLIKYRARFSECDDALFDRSFACFKLLSSFLNVDERIKRRSTDKYESVLFGTYEGWNSLRPMYLQARCVQNYIITLIDVGNLALARKCMKVVGENEFTSPYFKKRIGILY